MADKMDTDSNISRGELLHMGQRINLNQLKKRLRYSKVEITLPEIKEIMEEFGHVEQGRELIITHSLDCYKQIGTTLFSLNGSPPKCRALLLHDGYETSGFLILIDGTNILKLNGKIEIKELGEK